MTPRAGERIAYVRKCRVLFDPRAGVLVDSTGLQRTIYERAAVADEPAVRTTREVTTRFVLERPALAVARSAD